MSEGENGQDNQLPGKENVARTVVHRPASPAKRSATAMETGQEDVQMASPADSPAINTVEHASELLTSTVPNSVTASSLDGITTGNTSATSLPSPEMSESEDTKLPPSSEPALSVDEQVAKVQKLLDQPLSEGDRCVIISNSWLRRVRARSSAAAKDNKFMKADLEGDIGPLDNADIVPDNAFKPPILKDVNEQDFIPIKPGLMLDQEIQALPVDAYGWIVGWYGAVRGQKPIYRYAYNTSSKDANGTNVVYELEPPVLTVRKVSHPKAARHDPSEHDKTRSATLKLKMKKTQQARGQLSPDDALSIVSSRFERYQTFLARAKDAAGIAAETKVKTWCMLKPTTVDHTQTATPSKLEVEQSEWTAFQEGVDVQQLAVKDETSNDKYNGKSTMETYLLFDDQTLILEELPSTDDGRRTGPKPLKSMNRPVSTSGRSSPAPGEGVMTRGRTKRNGKTIGTTGLNNLGNTCYMNSALQCIRSVEELAIYFLADKHKREINNNNPLGHKGAMANKYAEVLRGIYKQNAASFSPSAFKNTLGRIMPTFSGFGQQDSQEFLSFLVDALHEDLNRIQSKPYRENPDSEDSRVTDPNYIVELGEVYRKNHRDRNDSIAMDLFSGFYKNTMECPVCDKISVTFDPYSSLTLQLPIGNTYSHEFIFVPRFGTPIRHDLDYERLTTVRDIHRIIAAKHPGVDANTLWMTEVYQHKIYKHFPPAVTLAESSIGEHDHMYIYELDHDTSRLLRFNNSTVRSLRSTKTADEEAEAKKDAILIPIYHRSRQHQNSDHTRLDLIPGLLSLTKEETKDFEYLQKKILLSVSQMTTRSILDEAIEEKKCNTESASDMEDVDVAQQESVDDGYVNVSIEHGANGDVEHQPTKPGKATHVTSEQLMSQSFKLPTSLTDNLYALNYAKASSFTREFLTGYDERSIRALSPRVKSSRRSSVSTASESDEDDVKSSTEEPTPSAADESENPMGTSPVDADIDADILDEQPPEAETIVTSVEQDSDEGLAKNSARPGKANKFKGGSSRGKPNKRKDKAQRKQERNRLAKEKRSQAAKAQAAERAASLASDDADETEDYLFNGECILVDWFAEAYDGLFGGSLHDEGDLRGHAISDESGTGFALIQDEAVKQRRDLRQRRKKFGITLEDCFAETGRREKLSEDNAWYCNRCKELRQASKTLEIWTLPDILVLHLKRFGGNRRFNDKIDVLVDYPVEGLDLNDKVGHKEDGRDYTYDLFAVDNHFGGLGGGHYTAIAKSFFDQEWYDYNDSSCTKQGDAPRKSAAAYLLFYRRRSTEPLGPPYLKEIVKDFWEPQDVEGADESDSGEGWLGDQVGSLRGSPSDSRPGAGAGTLTTAAALSRADARTAVSALAGDGLHGQVTPAVGLSQRQTQTAMIPYQKYDSMEVDSVGSIGMLNGKPLHGPPRPQHLQDFRAEQPSWGFDDVTRDDTVMNDDENNDADSTKADGSAGSSLPAYDNDFAPEYQDEEWNNQETQFSIGRSDDDHIYNSYDKGAAAWSDMQHVYAVGNNEPSREASPEADNITLPEHE